jgi:hypothetical protein
MRSADLRAGLGVKQRLHYARSHLRFLQLKARFLQARISTLGDGDAKQICDSIDLYQFSVFMGLHIAGIMRYS